MKLQGALFDLDGVLVDSEGVYYDFWDEIDHIYPTGIENYASVIKGTTLTKIMSNYTDSEVRADITRRLKKQEEEMKYVLFDGVIELLEKLRAADVKCAIVTSSNDKKMTGVFSQNPGFKDYFAVIVTDSMVSRSKPDPEGYVTAATLLGLDPKDCAVFEDSFSGLEAGRRSGAYVVGLATTNPREALEGRADMLVDHIKDLDPTKLFDN